MHAKKKQTKKTQIRLINMHLERIRIDCTRALDFENPSLSGVLAVAPNIPDIPKYKLNVLDSRE